MMHPFLETLSIAGGITIAVAGGIILLAVFFKLFRRISEPGPLDVLTVKGVIRKGTIATVHLSGNRVFERVTFLGFTQSDSMKNHIPYELNGMLILEDEQKTRHLIRAADIRSVSIPPSV